MYSNMKYEETPWSSIAEWREVYKYLEGKKFEDWRNAYGQMAVWKVRVAKLPIGIEATIPLIIAKIASEDRSLDELYKYTILSHGILKFVSIATKGYREKYLLKRGMHELASEMKLPVYLIDLRHQIIHSDSIISNRTIEAALEICFSWIKVNYWDIEEKKKLKILEMRKLKIEEKKKRKIEKEKKLKTTQNELEEITVEQHQLNEKMKRERILLKPWAKKFKDCINERLECLDFKSKQDTESQEEIQCIQKLNESIKINDSKSRRNTLTILVSELFYAPQMVELDAQLMKSNSKSCSRCKCTLPMNIIQSFEPHLRVVSKADALNGFIQALINRGNEFPSLCSNWLLLLENSSLTGKYKKCLIHFIKYFYHAGVQSPILWGKHLQNLMLIGEIWSVTAAMEIIDRQLPRFPSQKVKAFKELAKLRIQCINDENSIDTEVEDMDLEEALFDPPKTVDDVIELIKTNASESEYQYALSIKEMQRKTKNKQNATEEEEEDDEPDEAEDEYFYKKLLLHIPDSKK